MGIYRNVKEVTMYIVWTRPSTAKSTGSGVRGLTAKEAIGAAIGPVLVRGVIPVGMPMGSTIGTVSAGTSAMFMLSRGMSPSKARRSNTLSVGKLVYYEHARHASKRDASAQMKALKKAGFKVKVT